MQREREREREREKEREKEGGAKECLRSRDALHGQPCETCMHVRGLDF